ncbi:MAG: hypothetical protein AB7G65_20020 [Thermoleophilia bacterium]
MQTTLYTPAGQPAQANPIVLEAIAELNAAAAALTRAAYGLAFLNDGDATDASPLGDMVSDLARSVTDAVGGPMVDAIELADMVEGFRDDVARSELQAMQDRAGGALRLGRPAQEVP